MCTKITTNDPTVLKILLKEKEERLKDKEEKEEVWKERLRDKERDLEKIENLWKERLKERVEKEEVWKERLKDKEGKEKDWEKIEVYMKEKITELNTQVLALKSKSEGMDAHLTYLSSSKRYADSCRVCGSATHGLTYVCMYVCNYVAIYIIDCLACRYVIEQVEHQLSRRKQKEQSLPRTKTWQDILSDSPDLLYTLVLILERGDEKATESRIAQDKGEELVIKCILDIYKRTSRQIHEGEYKVVPIITFSKNYGLTPTLNICSITPGQKTSVRVLYMKPKA